jgi:hypothetical protein
MMKPLAVPAPPVPVLAERVVSAALADHMDFRPTEPMGQG